MACKARSLEISANTKESKKLLVSAIEAIEAPTPPAPTTRIFIVLTAPDITLCDVKLVRF
jgi:hypothetical protein